MAFVIRRRAIVAAAVSARRRLSEIFYPNVTAFNSIPRIALAPIIILAFGIGCRQ